MTAVAPRGPRRRARTVAHRWRYTGDHIASRRVATCRLSHPAQGRMQVRRAWLDEIWIDRAHGQKQAAATAMNPLVAHDRLAGHVGESGPVRARLGERAAAKGESLARGDDLPRVPG